MKTKLLLLVITLLSCLSQAQNTNDRKIYIDSTGRATKNTDYNHYLIIENYNLDQDKYTMVEYNKQDAVVMKGTITDKNRRTKNGEFTYYYDNGAVKEICNYTDSKLLGKYQLWYQNGNKKQDGIYLPTNKNNEQAFEIINFWNKENIQTVTDGNGVCDEEISFPNKNNLKVSIKGTTSGGIKEGKKQGKWVGEYPKIKLSFVENFKNGELVEGIATDSLGIKEKYTEILKKATYNDGIVNFYKYVGAKFNAAPKGNSFNISGKIFIKFTIKKDGSIDDVVVVRGLHPDLDKEAIRVIKNSKKWEPSRIRGQLIDIQYSMPISIQSNTSSRDRDVDPFFENSKQPRGYNNSNYNR